MEIRKLNKENYNELNKALQVQIAAYQIEADLLKVSNFPPLNESVEDIQSSLDESYVAISNNNIVGLISLEKAESNILISKLVVDPLHFRKGIGNALVRHCLSLYPKSEFQVGTGADNTPALNLYNSLGFKLFEEKLIEEGLKVVKLRRQIPTTELRSHWLLKIDKKSYQQKFLEIDLGIDLASQIAQKHGYNEKPVRIPQGSSLVFRLSSDYFLKLTPPFFDDSIEAELLAAKVIGSQLPFPIPEIIIEGALGSWKYVISKAVPGKQAKDVFGKMDSENRMLFAGDIGMAIKAIHNIKTTGFERKFGPWENYLSNRLENQKSIHLERGNSENWAEKIQQFVEKYSKHLMKLGPAKLVHADLNHEHLMLNQIGHQWRLSGIIDFADAMNAPIEMDFVLPILCFYRGKSEFQKKMFESADFLPTYDLKLHPNIMMALALQNRFIAFHDWFDREIEQGAQSVEEVAKSVFAPI